MDLCVCAGNFQRFRHWGFAFVLSVHTAVSICIFNGLLTWWRRSVFGLLALYSWCLCWDDLLKRYVCVVHARLHSNGPEKNKKKLIWPFLREFYRNVAILPFLASHSETLPSSYNRAHNKMKAKAPPLRALLKKKKKACLRACTMGKPTFCKAALKKGR